MSKVELTLAKLAELKQKAEAAETQGQSPWMFVKIEEEYHTYCEVRDMYGCQVVEDSTQEEAEHIAEADPATVLAMVEEIERLQEQNCQFRLKLYIEELVGKPESEAGQ